MSHPHTPQRMHAGIRKIAHQHTRKHQPPQRRPVPTCALDARNHYPQIKHHTPPPKLGATTTTLPHRKPTPHTAGHKPPPVSHTSGQRGDGLVVSKPNSVSGDSITATPAELNPVAAQRLLCTRLPPTTGESHPTNRSSRGDPQHAGRLESRGAP
jgi:hypothetical protein